GVAVLVHRPFHAAQGDHRLLEDFGNVRGTYGGGFERRHALAQDRQALAEGGLGGWRVVHGGLPASRRIVYIEASRPPGGGMSAPHHNRMVGGPVSYDARCGSR